MTDADINSLLFNGVISNLNELYGHNGDRLGGESGGDNMSFSIAFQPRPSQNFAHNYERDKFLHNRDKFVLLNARHVSMVAVKCYQRDYITVYRKPFEIAFPDDHQRVLGILEKLLNKFYDYVKVESHLELREVDLSNGRSPNRHRVVYEV